LSSQESDLDQTLALSFLLEDFDNSIGGWDDPTNSAFSLLVESPSGLQNLEHLSTEMDPTELHVVSPIFPSASLNSARISNELNDSVPFADSMNDEPLFQSPESLDEASDVPPLDGLYSTPLSWKRPKLGFRVGNSISYEPLSSEEESRLLAIAMPAQSHAITPPLSPSPEPQETRKRISRKRRSPKSSEADFLPAQHSRHLGPQKTAHHMVEKRYRTNLNQKIAALRDSVPSLRVFAKGNQCNEDLREDLQGLSQAKKLNKVFTHFHSLFCILPSFLLSLFPQSLLHDT
jgi:Helix-loop-helix DNA-binding domain